MIRPHNFCNNSPTSTMAIRDNEAMHASLSTYDLLLHEFSHLTISSKLLCQHLCANFKSIDSIIFEKLFLKTLINPKWVAHVLFMGVLLYNIQKHSLKWPHFKSIFLCYKIHYTRNVTCSLTRYFLSSSTIL